MPILKCPTCGATLSVDSTFPVDFRCPKCMGIVPNPPRATSGKAPMRVIPMDVEARGDMRASMIAIGCFAAALGLGIGYAVVMAWTRDISARDAFQLTVVGIVALILGVFVLTQARDRSGARSSGNISDTRPDSNTIDYQTPTSRRPRQTSAGRIGSIVGAFIAGMLMTIGLLILIVLSICGGVFK